MQNLTHSCSLEKSSAGFTPIMKRHISSKQEALLLKFKIFYNVIMDGNHHNPQQDQKVQQIWTKFQQMLSESNPQRFDAFINEVRAQGMKMDSNKNSDVNTKKSKCGKTSKRIKSRSEQKDRNLRAKKWRRVKSVEKKGTRTQGERKKQMNFLKQEISYLKQVLTHGHKFISQ